MKIATSRESLPEVSVTVHLKLPALTLSDIASLEGDIKLERQLPETTLRKKEVLISFSLNHLILDFYPQHMSSIIFN